MEIFSSPLVKGCHLKNSMDMSNGTKDPHGIIKYFALV
jgi:hypothetical protein